jgi:hypothetical protein
MNTRRSFLKGAGGGLLGLFGFLLPRRLFACHRGRFARQCVAVEREVGYPAPAMVPSGDFIIDYPDEGVVHGNGGFFAWGTTVNANVKATGATCAGVNGVAVTPPSAIQGNSWAYRFDNVGVGRTVTFTINGTTMTVSGGMAPAAPGSFTFQTAAP